jgi:hypothetical protein
MWKKLQNISWGIWAAVLGLVVFLGIALIPDIMASVGGQTGNKTDDKKHSLMGMLSEAEKKAAKEKNEKCEMDKHGFEVKSVAVGKDGTVYLGAKDGLYRIEQGNAVRVKSYTGEEAKAIAFASGATLFVGAKDGLWKSTLPDLTQWEKVSSEEVRTLTASGDRIFMATKHSGLMESVDDGKKWTPVAWTLPSKAKMEKSMKAEGKDHHKSSGPLLAEPKDSKPSEKAAVAH